ncbi:hypothetical protein [Nocardioides sp. Root151]|uniref:hypothetical protein n=1 Tax=Nocardioides sp. Root151 TaxID=1736475 RepID=UPI000702ABA1|nr:hypothetical protein [Nocardioides sp. Root151]KQZ66783.1 hypothetical protein ASD66_17250 [Nocardioides sp. Root151]
MNHKLSDETIGGLPLHEGRAELLEEIMATPVLDVIDTPSHLKRPRPRWITVAAAAASIAVIAGVPAYLLHDDGASGDAPAFAAAVQGPVDRALLGLEGWRVINMVDGTDGEIVFANGGQQLDVQWSKASEHDDRVDDRGDAGDPDELRLWGEPALMFAYGTTDHTVIRGVDGDGFLEIRGSGMDEQAFRALLDDLQPVDVKAFAAGLPPEVVTPGEQAEVVTEMLSDVKTPVGFDPTTVRIDGATNRYQLGAKLTGTVACVWLDKYAAGQARGDDTLVDRAANAMKASHSWAILDEMATTGAWPEQIWEQGDAMAAGRDATRLMRLYGCNDGTMVDD